MPNAKVQFFNRCSFLTQMLLIGWQDEKTPIWEKLLRYGGKDDLPNWYDWKDARNNLIEPLCKLASKVTLFGNEWSSEKIEVVELRKMVEEKFRAEGKALVCDQPLDLLDFPLFWTGGNYHFVLIKTLSFKIENLRAVLEILRYHHQAGTMSPRSGGVFTLVNNYAKACVKSGGFAVIFGGIEAEMFYPIEFKDQVEKVACEVEELRLQEAKMVKMRIQGQDKH